MRVAPTRALAALAAAALALLSACATSEGTLYEDTVATEEAALPQKETPQQEPEAALSIVSDPDGAEVYLNLQLAGLTPLEIEELEPGSYRVTLVKEGYRSVTVWLDYRGTPLLYSTTLQEITGFITVSMQPPEAVAMLDGAPLPAAGGRVRVGNHELVVRAFGFQEHRETVQIKEDELLSRAVTLAKAPFEITRLDASRLIVNPENPGTLGSTRVSFRVTAPGAGELAIRDPDGQAVFTRSYEGFSTWEHSLLWDARTADGRGLPDGVYTVQIQGASPDGSERSLRELEITVSRTAVINYRSLASAGAGLFYAHVPDTLPRGALQISLAVVGHVDPSSGGYRFPALAGMRIGLGPAEIDLAGGIYISNYEASSAIPFFANISARYALLHGGPVRLAAAVSLAYHSLPTDSLTAPTGLAIEMPARVALGPVSLLLAPEIVFSYRRVSYEPTVGPPGFTVWAYGRAGLLVDLGPLTLGVSSALRSLPFTEGLGLDLPLAAAAEAHLLVPGTSLVLSAAVTLEARATDDLYLMGGGGFGLIQ